MASLLSLAPWIILIYALLVAAGGIIGYWQAQSKVSLIMGLASGIILLATWWLYGQFPATGIGVAGVVAIALTGVFAMRYVKTKSLMPAGLMAIVSIVVGSILVFCLFKLNF